MTLFEEMHSYVVINWELRSLLHFSKVHRSLCAEQENVLCNLMLIFHVLVPTRGPNLESIPLRGKKCVL